MTVLDEIKAAISGSIFTSALGKMSVLQKAMAYIALKAISEVQVKHRMSELRESLFVDAEKLGTKTEMGGFVLEVGGHKVCKERREASSPDPKGVRELLILKGIPPSRAFTEMTVKVSELDISKLELLVQTGHITPEEMNKLRAVSWALKVTPNTETKALLERITPQEAAAEQERGGGAIGRVTKAARPHRRRSRRAV